MFIACKRNMMNKPYYKILRRGYFVAAIILYAIFTNFYAVAEGINSNGISDIRADELIYKLKQDCGSCHGLTLKGGLGPALLPKNLVGKSDEILIDTILYGRAGTPMPPWNFEISKNEAKWLVKILKNGID